MGCTVVFKSGCLSGVLGISNYTRRVMYGREAKRYCFVIGLILSGLFMYFVYGGREEYVYNDATDEPGRQVKIFIRMAMGGILVGWGAAFQLGCTSGHGLTGLARLSYRSWAAVICFMGGGFITASFSQSSLYYIPNPETEADIPDWWIGASWAMGHCVLLLVVAFVLRWYARSGDATKMKRAQMVGEFICGWGFGVGLVISGMARPSKVAGFLDVLNGNWDFTLAGVMGGALAITFPYFQIFEIYGLQKKAFLHPTGFDLPPTRKMPSFRFCCFSVIFGVGWSVCGTCPGPMWVSVGLNPCWETLTCVLGTLGGLTIAEIYNTKPWRRKATPPAEKGVQSNPADVKLKATATEEAGLVIATNLIDVFA